MQYEGTHHPLCDTESAKVIDVYRTEAECLAMVRGLLEAGWGTDHLALGLDFDEGAVGDDADLPPVLGSASLAARAYDVATIGGQGSS